ncbi:MAG: S8 family serine peptidase, partial [Chlorobi bacterium]|nr:S8 family serine peptidase [Chlorobiota bacterium]
CYIDDKREAPWWGDFECVGGEPMPETSKMCSYVQSEIISISPSEGAVGDEIKILLPYIYDIFSDCSWTWIYATHDLSAKVYFSNIETTLKYPINDNALGEGGQPIYVSVPSGASTGKIRVELICESKGGYGDFDYDTTMLSPSDFTVLTPSAQDDLSVRQQYLQQSKVDQAWNFSHGSSEVVVAVIDDGIYTGHPDLDSNMWLNFNEVEGNGKDDDDNGYIDDRWGWDFVSNSKDMTTLGTHGTMVAGIIGSESNNNTGITGINWNIKLMPIIACDNDGCSEGAIKKGIKYAVDNGADIINLSLGGNVFNYTENYNEIIKYAFDKNVLVVIATGNGDVEGGIGRNLNITKVSPVCNDGNQNMVLGVGAIDEENKVTSWSNYGSCADVFAPGENIVSTAVPAYSTLNRFYDMADGTSFSAPIVSGIAALIKAKYPTIKNTAIRDRIINNSDYQNGVRTVNAYKAIAQTWVDSEKYINKVAKPVPLVPSEVSEVVSEVENVIKEEKKLVKTIDNSLSNRMSGNILLQVEKNGEGWYVNPDNKKKYYLGRPADAFNIMRNLGLGIKHSELQSYINSKFPTRLAGKILLDVEENGEAYYINPNNLKVYFLNRPADAFKVMRELGLGITNSDIRKIGIGEIN